MADDLIVDNGMEDGLAIKFEMLELSRGQSGIMDIIGIYLLIVDHLNNGFVNSHLADN